MTGIEAFLEMLAAAGVRYLFGNPGSTELALSDRLKAWLDSPRPLLLDVPIERD
jgi:hypothetical protein